jgi:L-fuculose-phosphate aldolase
MSESEARAEVVEVARAMNRLGLSRGTSGNVSARVEGGLVITPSAVPYEAMEPSSLVALDLDGRVREGGTPSTEWRFHAAVYRTRPEVGGVFHAHPPFCTTLACLGREIPAFHYMVAVAGGSTIRCAPYATFGTAALAEGVLAALEGRRACLLANHGMLAVGASPRAALELAVEVESLAEVYWRALQAGEPAILSDAEMAEVMERFEAYRSGR